MFGRSKKPTLEDGVRRQLLEGEQRKRPLLWFQFSSVSRPNPMAGDKDFFDLFSWLPTAIEAGADPAWTVDATDEIYVESFDSPIFGRHFDVYHNSVRMGRIQASPAYFDKVNYANVSMRLGRLHYLPYPIVHSLVGRVIWLVGGDVDQDVNVSKTNAALTEFLWEAFRLSADTDPDRDLPLFEHTVIGPCVPLRESVEHWVKNRIPPEELTKWRYEDGSGVRP
ncbi:MAG: hypothetical protein R3D68_20150 [Hyphomicrobiaceae bacterium]